MATKLSSLLESFFKTDAKSFEQHKKNQEDVARIQSYVQGLKDFYSALNGKKLEVIKESFISLVPLFEAYKSDKLFVVESEIAQILQTAKDDQDIVSQLLGLFGKVKEVLVENNVPAVITNEIPVDNPVSDAKIEPATTIEPITEPAKDTTEPTPAEKKSAYEEGFNEGRKYLDSLKDNLQEANGKAYCRQLAETTHAERPYRWVETWMKGFNEGVKFEETVMRELYPDKFPSEKNDQATN